MKKEKPEFQFLDSINKTKNNLLDTGMMEKDYIPYLINKCLSYHSDTIMHSNEMNSKYLIPKKHQYQYFLSSIRPRKRFSKWFKKNTNSDVEMIKKCYNISNKRALEVLKILTKEQISFINKEMDTGGVD